MFHLHVLNKFPRTVGKMSLFLHIWSEQLAFTGRFAGKEGNGKTADGHNSIGLFTKTLAMMPTATNHLCSAVAEEGNTQRKIVPETLATYCKTALCRLYQKTYLSLDGSVALNSFSTYGRNNL